MANTTRLKAVRSVINKDRSRLNMANWAVQHTCGTTLCLAGFAAELSGAEFDFSEGIQLSHHGVASGVTMDGRSVERVAIDYLDLDLEDAGDLFYTHDPDIALDKLDYLIEHDTLDGYEED